MAPTAPQAYIIDPSGDTIIALSNPGAAFAIWNLALEERSEQDAATINGGSEVEQEEPPSGPESSEEPDNVYEVTHVDGKVFITKRANAKENSDEESEQHQSDPGPTDDIEPTVEYQVSSKHLIMASGKFRRELTGTWAECGKGDDGLHHLTAENWDPEVFTIMLNILHLQNRKVPRSISLEELAKLAVLVDYYMCWEAVEMWTNIWIAEVKLQEPAPASYSRNLILWMLVAWVFDLDEEFEKTTEVTLRQCQTPRIDDMDLPIPLAVIESIELQRYQVIDSIISTCHKWMEKFRENTYVCQESDDASFSCGSILLGALTRNMHRLGYLSPRPEIPFEGHSITSIRNMESPCWYTSGGNRRHYSSPHECSLQTTLGLDIDAVVTTIHGMHLHDFRDGAKDVKRWQMENSYRDRQH